MSDDLFESFDSIVSKQWKQKIQFDLGGLDYNKTLLTNTNEGITIKPFYHYDRFKSLSIPNIPTSFNICESIFVDDVKIANKLALKALNSGVNCLEFTANHSFDCTALFENLIAEGSSNSHFQFKFSFLDVEFFDKLINETKEVKVFLNIDLIGNLVKNGNWFYNNDKDHLLLESVLKKANRKVSVLTVNVAQYQQAGAHTVQQIAYALAHGNAYLNFIKLLRKKGVINEEACQNIIDNIQFRFAIGSNYFFEIAKLRAFRYLWKLILDKYNYHSIPIIFSHPTIRNKTLYDPYVNMLRTTTECMSAILGGSNTICNNAFDTFYQKSNEFSERISRNQLLIMREESGFVNGEPVKGSYYVEELTAEIAEKALGLFKDIEKSGGFVKQVFNGTIQRKISENARVEEDQFKKGELVLVGTNKYVNKDERISKNIQLYPFIKMKARKTIVKPIIIKRIAEEQEQNRLKKEM